MCERSENEVVPISRLFNCSAEFELPKIWIRKRTFAMWLRFRIASHKITPVYGRSFNNTAALNGRQIKLYYVCVFCDFSVFLGLIGKLELRNST